MDSPYFTTDLCFPLGLFGSGFFLLPRTYFPRELGLVSEVTGFKRCPGLIDLQTLESSVFFFMIQVSMCLFVDSTDSTFHILNFGDFF